MKILVTGGAGFIGSHLCDALLARGWEVWALDNLWLGRERNIAHLAGNPKFHFVRLDLLERESLAALFAQAGFDAVFHLAANSDIRAGTADTGLDQRLNFQTTVEILEAMRAHQVGRLLFASTSAVFGENEVSLNETAGPLQPISFYGASKLAAEAYVSVYSHTLGLKSTILRFPNVVGERATHGAIYDFIAKLEKTPARLEVLGDGRQSKPYVYVGDLITAMLLTFEKREAALEVYHVAGEGSTSVREIAEIVAAASANPQARIEYTGGDRGWPGDVPHFSYDTSKIRALGWRPQRDSTQAVAHAVRRIHETGF
ncbi:MAG TPA: SDR family NAD(P)-dependent oxidoreductase [Burkholderiales bacterium]